MKSMKNSEKMNESKYIDEKYVLAHSNLDTFEYGARENQAQPLIHLQNATPLEILSTILKFQNSSKTIILGGNKEFIANFQINPEKINGAQLGIFTSGSTGEPKLILRELREVISKLKFKNHHHESRENLVWGLLFNPEKMSGIQVLLSAYFRRESLYCPPSEFELKSKIRYLVENQINALSATPSLWKFLIQDSHFRDLNLKQITLGGEASDSQILNVLHQTFPAAKINQIYASTEFGAIFDVRDGKPGFPISYLNEAQRRPQLRISSDEKLEVNFNGLWQSTEDKVKTLGDRVLFNGRSDKVVNIGGEKVDLSKVEAEILKFNNVVDVLVSPISNKITGNALIADVVLKDTEQFSEQDLKKGLRNSLKPVEVPALIRLVPKIAINSNGKRTIS
jgi:acyl-coenzyme A synthetase/AMP-(fatty) acid ligase